MRHEGAPAAAGAADRAYPRLAEELGYIQDENLEVELLTGEVTPNNVQAVIGGSLDAYLGGPEALAANEQGGDLVFVVGAANNSIWDIVTDPSISDLKQMEGKADTVSSRLDQHGLRPKGRARGERRRH